MAKHNCAACRFRARYDARPASLLGRIWRWHANWCPGWKAYMKELPLEKRQEIIEKYNFN